MIPHQRVSKDVYAMALAMIASLRSEDPFHKVGSVTLDAQGRVLSTGYNGLKTGFELREDEWQDREYRLKFICHSELNALSMCIKGEVFTLAATTLPCPHCAMSIIAHDVKRVLYGRLYKRDSSSLVLFERYGIETIHIPIEQAYSAIESGLPFLLSEPTPPDNSADASARSNPLRPI